jgi:hypothetical protein
MGCVSYSLLLFPSLRLALFLSSLSFGAQRIDPICDAEPFVASLRDPATVSYSLRGVYWSLDMVLFLGSLPMGRLCLCGLPFHSRPLHFHVPELHLFQRVIGSGHIPLLACYAQLPVVFISTFFVLHCCSILALIPFYSAHRGNPVPLDDDVSERSMRSSHPIRGGKGEGEECEAAACTARIPSHGVLVQPHSSLLSATRLPMLSLYSRRLPLLVAVAQLTRMQRQHGAHAHLHRVVTPRVSCLLTLISQRSSISILPLPDLVLCVCGHLLIATHRSTSSCYASPRVLRIGLGGAGNRRGLARYAGFWSSLELSS